MRVCLRYLWSKVDFTILGSVIDSGSMIAQYQARAELGTGTDKLAP